MWLVWARVRAVRGERRGPVRVPGRPPGPCWRGHGGWGGELPRPGKGRARGLMPARASGCESQEPRPVGAGRALGVLGRAGPLLRRCPCGHGRPPGGALNPGFGKDDSPPPPTVTTPGSGIVAGGPPGLLSAWKHLRSAEAGGCRPRGIAAWTTLLTQDPCALPPLRAHPSPAPRTWPPWALRQSGFPGVGLRGQGAGPSW